MVGSLPDGAGRPIVPSGDPNVQSQEAKPADVGHEGKAKAGAQFTQDSLTQHVGGELKTLEAEIGKPELVEPDRVKYEERGGGGGRGARDEAEEEEEAGPDLQEVSKDKKRALAGIGGQTVADFSADLFNRQRDIYQNLISTWPEAYQEAEAAIKKLEQQGLEPEEIDLDLADDFEAKGIPFHDLLMSIKWAECNTMLLALAQKLRSLVKTRDTQKLVGMQRTDVKASEKALSVPSHGPLNPVFLLSRSLTLELPKGLECREAITAAVGMSVAAVAFAAALPHTVQTALYAVHGISKWRQLSPHVKPVILRRLSRYQTRQNILSRLSLENKGLGVEAAHLESVSYQVATMLFQVMVILRQSGYEKPSLEALPLPEPDSPSLAELLQIAENDEAPEDALSRASALLEGKLTRSAEKVQRKVAKAPGAQVIQALQQRLTNFSFLLGQIRQQGPTVKDLSKSMLDEVDHYTWILNGAIEKLARSDAGQVTAQFAEGLIKHLVTLHYNVHPGFALKPGEFLQAIDILIDKVESPAEDVGRAIAHALQAAEILKDPGGGGHDIQLPFQLGA